MRRQRVLARQRLAAHRCPAKVGQGVCGGYLRTGVDALGRTVVSCDWCDRKGAGVCRDCSRPVAGQRRKALRCAYHTRLAKRQAWRRYQDTHRDTLNAKARAYARRPEVRVRSRAYNVLYRAAHPERVAQWKRAEARRDPTHRRAYQKRYRATPRPKRDGPRTCLTCPVVMQGRRKRCDACKRASWVTAIRTLAGRAITGQWGVSAWYEQTKAHRQLAPETQMLAEQLLAECRP